jgi:hypothetical protein
MGNEGGMKGCFLAFLELGFVVVLDVDDDSVLALLSISGVVLRHV